MRSTSKLQKMGLGLDYRRVLFGNKSSVRLLILDEISKKSIKDELKPKRVRGSFHHSTVIIYTVINSKIIKKLVIFLTFTC